MWDMGLVGMPKATDTSFITRIQFRNGSFVPTAPTGTPTYGVYSPSSDTPLGTGSVSGSDANSQTGFRTVTLNPSTLGCVAGTVYTVIIPATVSATSFVITYQFLAT